MVSLWKRLLLVLSVAALFGVSAWAEDATPSAPDQAPVTDVTYPDLVLKLNEYAGKTVRVHGTFHYMQTVAPIFELNMGDQAIDVFITELPPESQETLREMRQFSGIPLAVTGVVRHGAVHGNPILLIASKIDLEGGTAHFLYDSKNDILTYPEIVRYSQRFLHTEVSLQGRFDFRQTEQKVFTIWRGIDAVDIDFSRLPNDAQARIFQEPNFSNDVVTAKGLIRPEPGRKNHYYLEASSVTFPEAASASSGKDITYADLLATPAKYLNKSVQMRGSFECPGAQPSIFQMRVGPDTIEVVYEKLPSPIQGRIANLADFSEVAMRVYGTVRAYPDVQKRYYLVASRIDFVSE